MKQNDTLNVLAVNSCCYSIENQLNKEGYQKLCGQEFWQLISDSAKVINQFTLNFAQEFCDNGEINWKRIVEFNSKKKQA